MDMSTSSGATTEAQDSLRVTVGDGKYTVVLPKDGHLHALRYGEPWRDCVGDGLILALASEVEGLRQVLARIAIGASLPITEEYPAALLRCEIEDIARGALALPSTANVPRS